MAIVVDKCKITGLFGGFTTAKSSGRHFLAVLSPGPKVDKVELPHPPQLPPSLVFGSKIEVVLTKAEQKFSDFNGSFTNAESAEILIVK